MAEKNSVFLARLLKIVMLSGTIDAFVCSYMPQIFAFSSSLLTLKFSIHNAKTKVLLKVFDAELPYKRSCFEPLCLPAKMAAETVKRPILLIANPNPFLGSSTFSAGFRRGLRTVQASYLPPPRVRHIPRSCHSRSSSWEAE